MSRHDEPCATCKKTECSGAPRFKGICPKSPPARRMRNREGDFDLPEDAAIAAVHPVTSKRHDLYAEAMRLVGAKHSKYALVDLVNWLLHRLESKVVWADDASPFTGAQVKDLLEENQKLRQWQEDERLRQELAK